jgi:SAM-dependent methyltransferase
VPVEDRRRAWLAERRAAVVATYDDEAAAYDENPYPVPKNATFVRRLVETCPVGGTVLDAPCGTGRFFGRVTDAGRHVVGVDQSAGMLAEARARGLADSVVQVGLQEMAFERIFDGAMTIDAMENVPPEDWPLVLANLGRAVRPGCHLYLTIEEVPEADIDTAFAALGDRDLPAIRGEIIDGDVAGYHFYPGRDRVLAWLRAERLTIVEEDLDEQDGWSYRHLLVRTPG